MKKKALKKVIQSQHDELHLAASKIKLMQEDLHAKVTEDMRDGFKRFLTAYPHKEMYITNPMEWRRDVR